MSSHGSSHEVNFDAALRDDKHEGAWGFIARSDEGQMIAAGAGIMTHISDALHAEAHSCIAAIEETSKLGVFRVISNQIP